MIELGSDSLQVISCLNFQLIKLLTKSLDLALLLYTLLILHLKFSSQHIELFLVLRPFLLQLGLELSDLIAFAFEIGLQGLVLLLEGMGLVSD